MQELQVFKNSTSCFDWLAGTYSSTSGSPLWSECSPGFFNTADKSTKWDPWPVGKYNTGYKEVSCLDWADGYNSTLGSASWFAIWGDGMRKIGEGWDDGNLYLLDGCSDTCQVEIGYKCKKE